MHDVSSLHVIGNDRIALFMAERYSTIYTRIASFIRSSADGCLGRFPSSAIVFWLSECFTDVFGPFTFSNILLRLSLTLLS